MSRHLCSAILLSLALGAPSVLAQVEVEGGEGLGPPPGSTGEPETPGDEGQPAEAQPDEGQPEEGQPTEGQPAEGAAPEDGAPEGEAGEGEGAALPPPAETEGAPAAEEPLRIIVIDAAPHGIAPVVGRHVTERMRRTAAEMGYEVVDPAATVGAAQRMQMPYPPSPADLWRVTYVARAQRGAFAKVWAHGGRYVFEITVASLDGAGPFFARGTSSAEDLHEVVAQLTREALPAPETYDPEAADRYARPQPAQQPQATDPERPPQPASQLTLRPRSDRVRVSQRRVSRRPARRWDLALQTEAVFGTSSDFFYNHLVGLRLNFRITHTIHLALYGAYANLRGRDSRENNLLPMLQLTNRIRLGSRSDITVPIRASVGYLPFNGPVIRLSGGLNIPVGDRIEIGADLLVPTFWFIPSGVEISLNVGLELIYRL